MNKKILILDQTLRDGEQQALINFNQEQKLKLAKAIKNIGVDYIDIMPIANEVEKETTAKLSEYPLLISTPLTDEAINLSLKFNKDIVLFQAVSDNLLTIRYKKNIEKAREENIRQFKTKLIDIRKRLGENKKIYVAGEDTSRANLNYLVKFTKCIEKHIDGFFIADSVGYLIPEKTREIVQLLKDNIKTKIGIHAHNDLGFADSNTIEAILAGADMISGTFTGIGERAGNANLGNVFKILKKDYNIILKQINYDRINSLEKLIYNFAKRIPAKPLSKEAFYVESGIHVHALLKSPTAYSLIDPKILGYNHNIFFGKKCGVSNFKWYLGNKYSDKIYKKWQDEIKKISLEKNKSFSFKEVKKILKIK